jgi:hypothetical protein
MRETTSPKQVSRRRFVGITVVAGAAAAAGWGLFRTRRQSPRAMGFAPGTPLVRNPAFSAQGSKGITLATTTPKGERIAFRLDAEGRELWQSIPSLEEYREGKRMTAAQLLDAMIAKYPGRDAKVVRREASEFLTAALRAGIMVKPGVKVCVVTRVRKPA